MIDFKIYFQSEALALAGPARTMDGHHLTVQTRKLFQSGNIVPAAKSALISRARPDIRTIDMTSFDPVSAALGGLLIGAGALLLMLFSGRIAGISGIFADALEPHQTGRGWRIAFIVGLIAAPLVVAVTGRAVPAPDMPAWAVVIAGGLLVGFGTRLGSGCTSGHGVCGIARLSPRSLAATATFMVTAAVVVAVSRHVLGGQ